MQNKKGTVQFEFIAVTTGRRDTSHFELYENDAANGGELKRLSGRKGNGFWDLDLDNGDKLPTTIHISNKRIFGTAKEKWEPLIDFKIHYKPFGATKSVITDTIRLTVVSRLGKRKKGKDIASPNYFDAAYDYMVENNARFFADKQFPRSRTRPVRVMIMRQMGTQLKILDALSLTKSTNRLTREDMLDWVATYDATGGKSPTSAKGFTMPTILINGGHWTGDKSREWNKFTNHGRMVVKGVNGASTFSLITDSSVKWGHGWKPACFGQSVKGKFVFDSAQDGKTGYVRWSKSPFGRSFVDPGTGKLTILNGISGIYKTILTTDAAALKDVKRSNKKQLFYPFEKGMNLIGRFQFQNANKLFGSDGLFIIQSDVGKNKSRAFANSGWTLSKVSVLNYLSGMKGGVTSYYLDGSTSIGCAYSIGGSKASPTTSILTQYYALKHGSARASLSGKRVIHYLVFYCANPK